MTQPNILLILTDQQRVDTLGYRGLTPCRTSNIDRIATQGVSFDRAITPCPLCLPARTALFTGLYPHQTDTLGSADALRRDPALLTDLRMARYHISYAGKWHMGEKNIAQWTDRHAADRTSDYSAWCAAQGLADGWAFNDMRTRSRRAPHMSTPVATLSPVEADQTNDAWITDHAIALLRARPLDRPFFLACSFNGPHPPFQVPEPYFNMYDPSEVLEPATFGPSPGEPQCIAGSYYRTLWRDHGENWSAWRKSVAVYWGFVTMLDDYIGRLLNVLREEGLEDQTVIVFASDHGEMLGDHGLWHKYHAYESSLRVPLIMRGPGLPSGVRSEAPASLIDIAPTLLAVSGSPVSDDLAGMDLRTVLEDRAQGGDTNERLLFSEHRPLGDWHGTVDWRMVCDGRYKFTWNRGDRDELYDLLEDRHERTNRINDDSIAEQLQRLRDALGSWMDRTGDPLAEQMQSECRMGSVQ